MSSLSELQEKLLSWATREERKEELFGKPLKLQVLRE